MNNLKNERASRLFPAFGAPPAGNEESILIAYGADPDAMLASCMSCAPGIEGKSITGVSVCGETDLGCQLYTYAISCAFSDILSREGHHPDYSCGYSMGLYAAFYDTGAYSFEIGQMLLVRAYALIEACTAGTEYSTAVVVGLGPDDLAEIISRSGLSAEIVNVNNRHSMVVTSLSEHMPAIIAAARSEGAINIARMDHTQPYHMKVLKGAADAFRGEIDAMPIRDCRIPVLSARNRRVIIRASDVKDELASNLCDALDWRAAVEWLIARGVRSFVECGLGSSLTRFARFIPGEYRIGTAAERLAPEGTRRNAS